MEKEALEKQEEQFHIHNYIKSEKVEAFLQAFDKGERGTALRMLDDQEVFIVDAIYLEGMRNRVKILKESNENINLALDEIRAERDKLLTGLYTIYSSLGFIIEAVRLGLTTKKSLKGASLVKNLLKVFGFKELSLEIGNVIVAIILSIKKNFPKMKETFPQMGDNIMPGLKVLEKHNIISPIDFNHEEEE